MISALSTEVLRSVHLERVKVKRNNPNSQTIPKYLLNNSSLSTNSILNSTHSKWLEILLDISILWWDLTLMEALSITFMSMDREPLQIHLQLTQQTKGYSKRFKRWSIKSSKTTTRSRICKAKSVKKVLRSSHKNQSVLWMKSSTKTKLNKSRNWKRNWKSSEKLSKRKITTWSRKYKNSRGFSKESERC